MGIEWNKYNVWDEQLQNQRGKMKALKLKRVEEWNL